MGLTKGPLNWKKNVMVNFFYIQQYYIVKYKLEKKKLGKDQFVRVKIVIKCTKLLKYKVGTLASFST